MNKQIDANRKATMDLYNKSKSFRSALVKKQLASSEEGQAIFASIKDAKVFVLGPTNN